MFFPLFAFLSYLLFMCTASAQIHAPTCSVKNGDYDWAYNSLKQDPCSIAAYLSGVCSNGTFTLPALGTSNVYSVADNGNQCMCNTVVYNLFSACCGCQGGSWNPYSAWSSNCITKATAGTFPEPIPDGTRVPQWAYINTSGGTWNFSVAQAEGGYLKVTATSSIFPASTSWVAQSTITPNASGGSSSSSTSKSSSKTGAIVGCIVSLTLIAGLVMGLVARFVVRRRRACSPPSDTSDQGGKIEQPVPYPLTIEPPILYDPSDPTTYPNQEHYSKRNRRFEPTRHLPRNYSGLPEIS